MGFPTKNAHFGVFWGTTILENTHMVLSCFFVAQESNSLFWETAP